MLFETSRPLPTLYARDILQDPFYRRLQVGNLWAWIYFGHALLLYALGVGFGYWLDGTLDAGLHLGWSIVVWGVFVRAVLVWHVTWSVNSFTHYSGYRTYETRDDSRNNPIVAFFTAGEGWHNNHHGDPASCCNTHRWWEFDLTWQMIRMLAVLGLASDLVLPRAERRKQREQDKQAA
jgi:stearoyl-CoA desaturase (delta-9 desaturase)